MASVTLDTRVPQTHSLQKVNLGSSFPSTQGFILKNTKKVKAGKMAQLVKCLTQKHEDQSSIPTLEKLGMGLGGGGACP